MITSGYDCPFSIANLEDDDIEIIQNHIAEKAAHLLTEHSIYSKQTVFELLPGHRKVLFSLKSKAKEFGEKQNKHTSDTLVQQIELFDEEEVEKIGNNLIDKLNTFLKRFPQVNGQFDKSNISSSIEPYLSHNSRHSVRGKSAYKCTVKCVICDKIVPCTFNGHWQTSNLERHIKTHSSANKSSIEAELERILDT